MAIQEHLVGVGKAPVQGAQASTPEFRLLFWSHSTIREREEK